jgi:hypothetical protein
LLINETNVSQLEELINHEIQSRGG